MNSRLFLTLASFAGFVFCQDVRTDAFAGAEDTVSRLNQVAIAPRANVKGSIQRQAVVFPGDSVIPHVVDGSSWRTSIMFVNLENKTVHMNVYFFQDSGDDLYLTVAGQGTVRGMSVTLGPAASIQFETLGTRATLASGWAYMQQDDYNDSIGGMAVFRQSIPGRPDFEAVVPIVNQFSGHFALYYDNEGYTTAVAIANPTSNTVTIPVRIHAANGTVVANESLSLGPYQHVAFALPAAWATTAGSRGTAEFMASGFGVGVVGLRFGGASFTSFQVLENFNWVVAN